MIGRLNHVAIADAPKWLLDLVVEKPRAALGTATVPIDPEMLAMYVLDAGDGLSDHPEDCFAPMTIEVVPG